MAANCLVNANSIHTQGFTHIFATIMFINRDHDLIVVKQT